MNFSIKYRKQIILHIKQKINNNLSENAIWEIIKLK